MPDHKIPAGLLTVEMPPANSCQDVLPSYHPCCDRSLCPGSFAAPTPIGPEERGLLDSVGSLVNGVVSGVVSRVVADATDAAATFAAILSEVEAVVPTATLTIIPGNKWTTMSRSKIK